MLSLSKLAKRSAQCVEVASAVDVDVCVCVRFDAECRHPPKSAVQNARVRTHHIVNISHWPPPKYYALSFKYR